MSDTGEFAPLVEALEDLTQAVAPEGRRRLANKVATDVRARNAQRIAGNVTPDGEPMVPRKPKKRGSRKPGRLRTAMKMFRSAGRPQFLRKKVTDGEIEIGFAGAMARIMRVHHYGLRDTVTRAPNSPQVTYAARPVIGLPTEDRLRILEQVEEHLKLPG